MAKLHFYYSATNAGKTTLLLQSNYNYLERGMNTLLYIPKIDNRVQEGLIASRIGLKAEAKAFDNFFNIFLDVQEESKKQKIHCVFVDEAQFLKKSQVEQLTDIVDVLNIPVLTYGLRSDFQGEPFEGSLYLMTWAEELSEIKTICHCGSKATRTLRLDSHGQPVFAGDQIAIGGNESYLSVCRKHYKNQDTGVL